MTSVQPSPGWATPPASATVSRARTTVVPTAITRPPLARVALTRAAVVAGTRNGSGVGSSPVSSEPTPAWRTTGVMPMPRATRAVISSAVKARPALGISALPGSLA